jgi:DNA-binding MarR family transcriptional regulator
LLTTTTEAVRDSKGRTIPTVIAKPMTESERSAAEAATRTDEDALLIAIANHDRASMAGLADALQWITRKGKPDKSRVQRCADRLKRDKLVNAGRGGTLTLTEKGKAEATRVKQNADLAGARYG